METVSFEDLGLDDRTLEAVSAKGFLAPSPIQVLTIPRLLESDANIIAKARTGTGKTAAFGLPLVQNITADLGYVQALILTPTRELCMQVCREIRSFCLDEYPRLVSVYGGQSIVGQMKDVKRGCEIVVGTPGRVMDLINRGVLSLDKISYFILDEADEMLDMGFVDDIKEIFSHANTASRILLFSATMPKEILEIAGEFMGEYDVVEEETPPEEPVLTQQRFWFVRESERIEALVRLIDISPDFYGLIFTQTKVDADIVQKQLDERGYEVAALHGDIAQSQREKILSRFRRRKTRILVATDVAARGIDIEGLTHVVNYSMPFDVPSYIHRIGRTGRAGAKGLAFTFVRPEEKRRLDHLRRAVQKSIKSEMQEEDVPTIEQVIAVKKRHLFEQLQEQLGLIKPHIEDNQVEGDELKVESIEVESDVAMMGEVDDDKVDVAKIEMEQIESDKIDGDEAEYVHELIPLEVQPAFMKMAKKLCKKADSQELLAAVLELTYGKALDPERYGKVTRINRAPSASGNQMRLYVQLGRRDGYNPRKVADFFSSLLRIKSRQVDDIDMADNFCLVSLPTGAAKIALDMSRRDRRLPHMHIDEKSGFGGGKKSRRKRFEDDLFELRSDSAPEKHEFGDDFASRDSGRRKKPRDHRDEFLRHNETRAEFSESRAISFGDDFASSESFRRGKRSESRSDFGGRDSRRKNRDARDRDFSRREGDFSRAADYVRKTGAGRKSADHGRNQNNQEY